MQKYHISGKYSTLSPYILLFRSVTRLSRSRSRVNPDDLDLDRDITNPVNRTGGDATAAEMTTADMDMDQTMMPPVRLPRKRRRDRKLINLDSVSF